MKKILLVEDNEMASMCAKSNIEKLGFSCDTAEDGETAIRMFAENYYELVLMDIDLGNDIDGYETTKRIRQIEAKYKRDRTPIVALTGYEKEDVYDTCLSSGMNGLLEKPLNPYRSFQQSFKQQNIAC